jgi:hypothetical protein
MNNGRRCPKCNYTKLSVIESSPTFNNTARRIRRRCLNCNHSWTIYEVTAEILDHYRNLEKKLDNLKTFMLSLDVPTKSCNDCHQFTNGKCLLSLPEAGGSFAEECSYFFKP